MKVMLKLVYDVHDLDEVVTKGNETIKAGWGYDSVEAYLEEVESSEDVVVQAMYEIVTASVWNLLGPETSVELVDSEVWS